MLTLFLPCATVLFGVLESGLVGGALVGAIGGAAVIVSGMHDFVLVSILLSLLVSTSHTI